MSITAIVCAFVLDVGFRIPGTTNKVPSSKYKVQSTKLKVQSTKQKRVIDEDHPPKLY
jgi:hypothetical protein